MGATAAPELLRPRDRRLIAVVCAAQCLLIAVPALRGSHYIWLVSAALLTVGGMLFSANRALLVLLATTIVLPMSLTVNVRLPAGLRPTEILLMVTFVFLLVEVVFRRGLKVLPSSLHLPVLVFLGAAVLSGVVGIYYGNDGSLIQRNLRYPLYYVVVFAVTQAVDRDSALKIFLPLLGLAGVAVSAQYIVEFIHQSSGDTFFRVVRWQGLILPTALLLLANQFVHDPRRYGRLVLAALFLPTGLAFALTVGRGMWVAFMVGLSVTVWLRYIAQPLADRRAWRSILLAVGMVFSLVATVLVFQRFTGAAITTQAVERSRTFVDYQRDVMVLSRLLGYARALDVIAERPILGSGQGKTLTFYSFNPETNKFETWTSWTMDSLYLALWLKMGLPGLLAFGWLCIHVLRTAWKSFRGSADPRVQAFMSGAIAVLVANLVLGVADGSMVTGRFAVVFGVLFGMVEVVARQSAARVAAGPEAEARGAPGRATTD